MKMRRGGRETYGIEVETVAKEELPGAKRLIAEGLDRAVQSESELEGEMNYWRGW